ncbi:MAG: glycosyltransferase family 2 protein [Methylosarcina sp.]
MFPNSNAPPLNSALPYSSYSDNLHNPGYSKSYLQNQPLISIITVVYNGGAFIEQTIRSVMKQTYPNVEFIIIDGSSHDDTLEIISRYKNAINYWLSEPDKGIADAMNKGLSMATGDYVLFIHADDYLAENNSLDQAVGFLKNQDIVLFDILYGRSKKQLTPRGFNFWMNFKTGVYHQGSLCKREIFNRIGGFDIDFKIAMDFDFFLRAYRHGIQVCHYPLAIAVMGDTGISASKDWPTLLKRFDEEQKAQTKNCNSSAMAAVYSFYWRFYMLYRRIRKFFI